MLTKLDYCNLPLVGLPAKLLNRLQAVINTAARLVCHAVKADHITPVLKDLHCLRIQERIQYKLCVITFKCQHSLAPPPYLSNQLQQVARMEPRQRLRSSSSPALVVPATSSSRMRVIYHNWSATKQRPHPQSVAEISHHSVLSGDRIRHPVESCETSSGSRHKDTDQCL